MTPMRTVSGWMTVSAIGLQWAENREQDNVQLHSP
jgi:hypothetical protein